MLISCACAASDWPMFRENPSRTGYTNLTGDLGPDHIVAWTFTAPNGIFASPAVADLNADGKLEIVVPVEKGDLETQKNLFVLSSAGRVLWDFTADGSIHSSPAMADLDDDSKPDVVFGTNRGRVYALDGEKGSVLWSIKTPIGAFRSSPLAYDVDGDNNTEIVIGSSNGTLYCIDGKSGTIKWRYQTGDEISSSPSIIGSDIVFGSADNKTYALDGKGKSDWNLSVDSPIVYSTAAALSGGSFAIGTNDGRMLIAASGKVYREFKANGSITGSPAVGVSGSNEIIVFGSAVEEDIHGNYIKQVDNRIYAINSYGVLLWSFDTGGWSVFSSPALADVNRDRKLEAVVGTREGRLYVLDAETGKKKWDFFDGTGIYASPAIADVDGDGDAEIVVAYRFSNQVKLIDSPDKPDLMIASISFSDDFPENGKVINLTAVIKNRGKKTALAPVIRFYRRSPILDYPLSNMTLSDIGPGASANVTLVWNATMPPSEIGIYIVADPKDVIDESNELNNDLYRGFYNDLYISGYTFPEEIRHAAGNTGASLTTIVFNKGRVGLTGVEVALLLRRENRTTQLAKKSVDIKANSQTSVDFSFTYEPWANGTQNLSVIIDPANKIKENSKENNVMTWALEPPVATETPVKKSTPAQNQNNTIVLLILLVIMLSILWEKIGKAKVEKIKQKREKAKAEKQKKGDAKSSQPGSESESSTNSTEAYGIGYSSEMSETPGESSPDKPVE